MSANYNRSRMNTGSIRALTETEALADSAYSEITSVLESVTVNAATRDFVKNQLNFLQLIIKSLTESQKAYLERERLARLSPMSLRWYNTKGSDRTNQDIKRNMREINKEIHTIKKQIHDIERRMSQVCLDEPEVPIRAATLSCPRLRHCPSREVKIREEPTPSCSNK